MTKPKYNTRQMTSEDSQPLEEAFFFPKANPPVSIVATSRAEAEKILEARNKKEND